MNNLSSKDYSFLGVQFLLFIVYIIDFMFFEVPQLIPDFVLGLLTAIGLALCLSAVVQLNTNFSPFPRPKSNSKLVKNGIFKYIRHPIYTGLFIGLLAYGLYTHSSSKILVSLILLILFYFKSNFEESLLMQKFPDYKSYSENTGKFFPKLKF
jgi:protein-S-isoprenylcysteine O-methyltransferase Ste14